MDTKDPVLQELQEKIRQLHEQLEESKERCISLLEHAQDIILFIDLKGNILSVNRVGKDFTKKEVEGKRAVDMLDPKDIKAAKKMLQKVLTHGSPEVFECRIPRSKRWFSSTIGPVRKEGKIVGAVIIARNITAAKNAEQELLLQKNFAENLIETAQAIVLVLDTKGHIVRFNRYMEDISGYRLDEVKGKSWLTTFIPEHEQKRIREVFVRAITDTQTAGNINSILTKDGKEREIEWYDKTLKDNEGKIIGILAIGQDITNRLKAEKALQTSEAHLSNAMKIAQLGHWEYDSETNLFTFNDHFYSIFRTSAEKVGGYKMSPERYAELFLHPDDREIVALETQKAMETTDPNFNRQLEHRIIYADGNPGYISVRFFIIKDKNGKTIKTYGVNQDITERKIGEERLKESLEKVKKMNKKLELAKIKAEESDKLKSAFLANMSHEIRTPMNSIIGFAKILNRKNLREEKRKQFTEIIKEMSHQLLRLINDIIDISKIETGQIDIKIEKANINDLLMRLFTIYKPIAGNNNLNLYVQKTLSDEQSEIFTDLTKIRQILDNLISNAIKFTHKGYITFGYHVNKDQMEFFVEDTGIGIEKNIRKKIFEPFRQADTNVAGSYGGTGLGLSISKAYIEKLGGKIWLDSQAGEGSTFYFTIPFNQVERKQSVRKNNVPGKRKRKKPVILVVEDEEMNYLFIQEVLLILEVELMHARTGAEAIKFSKENAGICLILMDIKLPDINGYNVIRKIRSFRPDLPIIAQTAYAMSGDKEKAIGAGCDDYIAKPIDDIELVRLVESYLSGSLAKTD